ncbi:ATP-binding cassette domain-containing protein [Corynebacterium suedekumii]|nr:ATP-binding cassette domain-containing protein [Corynebacterium suedekumii]
MPGTITQVIGASGQGLTRWAHSLGHPVVGQDALAHVTFLRDTVAEEVAFGLEQRGVPAPEMSHRVARILELVALDPAADPATLSGGQTRRLAVATVAVLAPSVLVLDDPFAGLDADSARHLISLCRALTDTAVVVLGTRSQPLPGETLSLVDATLTLTSPFPTSSCPRTWDRRGSRSTSVR